MFKILKMAIFCFLLISTSIQNSYAKEICANCYWGTSCGSVSTKEVIDKKLTNHNQGVLPEDQGPFLAFYCDNGHKNLGVLWTDSSCGSIGGLSGLTEKDFPNITSNPKCKFGN